MNSVIDFFAALWLPILAAGVGTFVLSALVWTIFPHHKGEWQQLPNEDEVLTSLWKGDIKPGLYSFPFYLNPKERENPSLKARIERGPVGYATIAANGNPRMMRYMTQSLLFNLAVAFFVAYVTYESLSASASPLQVFRLAFTMTFMAYVFGSVPESIWFGRPWRSLSRQAFDSLLYSLLSASVFAWLWNR